MARYAKPAPSVTVNAAKLNFPADPSVRNTNRIPINLAKYRVCSSVSYVMVRKLNPELMVPSSPSILPPLSSLIFSSIILCLSRFVDPLLFGLTVHRHVVVEIFEIFIRKLECISNLLVHLFIPYELGIDAIVVIHIK